MEISDTELFGSGIFDLKNAFYIVDMILMTRMTFEESFEIYLFTDNGLENNFSKLNEFLSFLKFNKVNLPYKFSYVSRGDGLIPEMTLNENILMDFSPDSLTAARELQFQEFLKAQPNRDLEKLYHKLATPHELPAHSDAQMKKLASLIKSLIVEGQFIFLEEPEKDLDDECKKLFINALKYHISRNKQNVFIYSTDLSLWSPHVQMQVTRERDFSFSVEEITKNLEWTKEREQFYSSTKIKTTQEGLRFNIPTSKPRKKSAA